MYPRGGDCVVALNTASLLRAHGHEVRLYAMDYPDNLKLPDASGYASRVSFDGSLPEKLRAVRRLMGKGDVRESFRKVMREFRPDVVHLHNIHSYLSPVIGEIAASMGVRVVWTMHDYKLICPAYSCRRPDGSNCELCFGGNLHVAHLRCMKGSYPASFIASLEAKRWNRTRLQRFCSAFICPSEFMAECMNKAGFRNDLLRVLNNFADPVKFEGREPCIMPEPYFCYVGRLSEEKGVATLLRAARIAGVRLKVAGDGPLRESLQRAYEDVASIEFLGHLDASGVAEVLSRASASVIPSEWYENNPLGVIESLSLGTPVIGARIGGIPELIRDESDGLKRGETYPAGNAEALAELLLGFKADAYDRRRIAAAARERFSPGKHYETLMKIYSLH